MSKLCLTAGAVFGLIAVLLGAFGAHGLRNRLSDDLLRAWQTAVEYQFYHALALLALGLVIHSGVGSASLGSVAGFCFIAGVLMFSGSLYGLALGGPKLLGPVTPLGGLFLIAGWGCLLVAVLR